MNKAVGLYTKSLNRQKQVMKLNALIGSFLSKKDNAKHLVNLAGKQRMLTQRIAKLTIECRLHLLPKSCNSLEKFIALYDKTLNGFLNGDKDLNLEPVKSQRAIEQIKKLQKIWAPFKEAALKVNKSNGADDKAVAYILANNIKMLKESNELVAILEEIMVKN
jgi:methyl-accepting chemotaxis protein